MIVATATRKMVCATESEERIVIVIAGQLVPEIAADDLLNIPHAIDEIQRCIQAAKADRTPGGKVNPDGAGGVIVHQAVDAGAAVENVVARAAAHDVVAKPAFDPVVARA